MNLIFGRNRSALTSAYYTIKQMAELVKGTEESVLEDAISGNPKVFIRVPDRVNLLCVHEYAVDVYDESRSIETALGKRPVVDEEESKPLEIPLLDKNESMPLSINECALDGLMLTSDDCYLIKQMQTIRKSLFHAGVKFKYGTVDIIDPIKGHIAYLNNGKLPKDGWHIACYNKNDAIIFDEKIGYSAPLGVDVSLTDLFLTVQEVNRYIEKYNVSNYITELIDNGRVVKKLPKYCSEKLAFLVKINFDVWHKVKSTDRSNKSLFREKIDEARGLLNSFEFQSLLKKNSSSDGLIEKAVEFTTPIFARSWATDEEYKDFPTFMTPEILILLGAAKMIWGKSQVVMEIVATHPDTADIKSLLRNVGLTGDYASYAATLIRPEIAAGGKRVPDPRYKQLGRCNMTASESYADPESNRFGPQKKK